VRVDPFFEALSELEDPEFRIASEGGRSDHCSEAGAWTSAGIRGRNGARVLAQSGERCRRPPLTAFWKFSIRRDQLNS